MDFIRELASVEIAGRVAVRLQLLGTDRVTTT
jgi:hypothetical protein